MRTTIHTVVACATFLHTAATAAAAFPPSSSSSSSSSSTSSWTADSYDYIVVGAGPAGIIVADRLSETGKKTLLLEQGGPSYGITGGTEKPSWLNGTDLSRVDVPGLYSTIFSAANDALLCNARYTAYGGCNIGGSSSINAGLYFEPPASDFDNFLPEGWRAADVAPAIARLYARQPAVVPAHHQSAQSGYDAARQWLVEGAGYAEIDINAQPDRKEAVFGHTQYDYHDGQRGGPVTTFLQSALARENFSLRSNVSVIRAVRDGSRATGVLASVEGEGDVVVNLTSTGRIVFSGGAIFSPSLLMHSGIGPADVLTTMAQAGALDSNLAPSDWINNTEVGNGLFDNPNTFIVLSGPTVESYEYSYDSPIPADSESYLNNRTGPYSFAGQTSVFWTYINHTDTPPAGMQGTFSTAGSFGFQNGSSITLNVYGTSGMLSTGHVVVNQDSTTNKFIPGPSSGILYSDPAGRDADDISQFIFDIFSALDKSGSGLQPLNIAQNATKEEIKQYITTPSDYAAGYVQHWSSSCRIGACVDASTQVTGMDNLHVIDASILAPLTVNPQFGVMIAGERGAELIKELDARSDSIVLDSIGSLLRQ